MAELEHGNNLAHLESLFQMTTAGYDRTQSVLILYMIKSSSWFPFLKSCVVYIFMTLNLRRRSVY